MSRRPLPILLVIAALVLGGCGDGGSGDVGDGGVDAAAPADAGSEPDDGGSGPSDGATDDGGRADAGADDTGGDEPDAGPPLVDTDCDGLVDGPSRDGWLGEDLNGNGIVDEGETDPNLFDTDGDGLSDGVERGVTEPFDPVGCAGVFVPDGDPTTTTDPTLVDTDGDGIEDGVEDEDRDGAVDPGELDPADAGSPGALAGICAVDARAELSIASITGLDLALALPSGATTVEVELEGAVVGALARGVEPDVALIALRVTSDEAFADPDAVERAVRPALAGVGGLGDPVEQRTRTWDGAPALSVLREQAGALDADARANALLDALVPGSTGRLPAAAGVAGPATLRELYVLRSPTEAVVLISIAPRAATGATRRAAEDFVGAATLAPASASIAPTCRRLDPLVAPKVDLLFVVDDSGSMTMSQLALASTVPAMTIELDRAGIDWRIGLVTSSYIVSAEPNSGRFRRFTRNPNLVRAWLTQNSYCSSGICSAVPTAPEPATCPGGNTQGANGGCWIGIDGSGVEGILGAARNAVADHAPDASVEGESPAHFRPDALAVIVLLGDADDQTRGSNAVSGNCGTGGTPDLAGSSCTPVADFVRFFTEVDGAAPENALGASIPVHGIVCPAGHACGCSAGGTCDLANAGREFNPQPIDGVPQQRHAAVVRATGGVLGSIRSAADVTRAVEAITRDTIARAGQPVAAPVVGGSLRAALSAVDDPLACDPSALPSSDTDGHLYDARHGTVSWLGACRPASPSEHAVVSFQRWMP